MNAADAVMQAKRWYWQRISAMVLAVCVLVHLAVMIYAVHSGLSAGAILGRTRGNWAFAVFYAVFVLASTAHVPIGVANIAREWWGASEGAALWGARVVAAVILVMGLRAVYAMVFA